MVCYRSSTAPPPASGATSSLAGRSQLRRSKPTASLSYLVAQLNNQDPMNPMDNAQMTSQIAQINTVSGIQQLNETMKSHGVSNSTSMQVLQGAA